MHPRLSTPVQQAFMCATTAAGWVDANLDVSRVSMTGLLWQ